MNIIEKIHHEVDTAATVLLQNANDIITNNNITTETTLAEKADRLKKLGFVSATPVTRLAEIEEVNKKKLLTVEQQKRLADRIIYYQQTYPFFKFLTEEKLDEICNKYDLIYATANCYIKDIPEKNLRELENAQEIKVDDLADITIKLIPLNNRVQLLLNAMDHPTGEFTQQEIIDWCIKARGKNVPDWTDRAKSNTWLFVVNRDLFGDRYDYRYRTEIIDRSGYFIAAPKSHFNLKGLTEKGKGWFQVFKSEPKDPIVFKYVKGGVLVITKWGDEAEDPDLQIPLMN